MNKIQKVLRAGDMIYFPDQTKAEITWIGDSGFCCRNRFYTYQEHRIKYFLTKAGMENAKHCS